MRTIGPSLRLKKLTPREVTYLVQMAQLVSGWPVWTHVIYQWGQGPAWFLRPAPVCQSGGRPGTTVRSSFPNGSPCIHLSESIHRTCNMYHHVIHGQTDPLLPLWSLQSKNDWSQGHGHIHSKSSVQGLALLNCCWCLPQPISCLSQASGPDCKRDL